MLFWHLGVTSAIVFLTLGRRRIDYRVVMLGSILPDLIDKPIGRIFFQSYFQTSRLFGHTFLFDVVLVLGIQLVLRGKTARRWFVLPIGSLIHLALDSMWNLPVTLFWPLFGTRFPPEPAANYWLEVMKRPLQYPGYAFQELTGLCILLYMAWAYGLFRKTAFIRFVRSGALEDDKRGDAFQPLGQTGAGSKPDAVVDYGDMAALDAPQPVETGPRGDRFGADG